MVESSMAQQAERLSKRRARMLPVLAIFYFGQQVTFFSSPMGDRAVDHFKIGAWVALSLVLMTLLLSGGFWSRTRELRDLLEDETSRAHRADGLGTGFVVAMATGIILYVVGTMTPVSAREAIHIIVSFGIATALVRFGWLERRALRDA